MKSLFSYSTAAGLLSAALVALPAVAKTVQIEMKNRGADGMMVFEPAFATAQPGDVIHFVATDPGHNAETINAMLPAGATPAAGAMNQAFDYKVLKPGLYGFECKPHFGMGMVALIKVGTGAAPNGQAARQATLPPLAKKRMDLLLAAAGK